MSTSTTADRMGRLGFSWVDRVGSRARDARAEPDAPREYTVRPMQLFLLSPGVRMRVIGWIAGGITAGLTSHDSCSRDGHQTQRRSPTVEA